MVTDITQDILKSIWMIINKDLTLTLINSNNMLNIQLVSKITVILVNLRMFKILTIQVDGLMAYIKMCKCSLLLERKIIIIKDNNINSTKIHQFNMVNNNKSV